MIFSNLSDSTIPEQREVHSSSPTTLLTPTICGMQLLVSCHPACNPCVLEEILRACQNQLLHRGKQAGGAGARFMIQSVQIWANICDSGKACNAETEEERVVWQETLGKCEKLRDFAAVHTVVTGKHESATERTCVTRSMPAWSA